LASPAAAGLASTTPTDSVASARADGRDGTSAEDVGLDSTGLATNISGVLSRGSGNYNVVLNLHPPELGQVQARISLRGDLLQVDLSPEHAAAHDALESALPALRDHLAQAGVEVDVTLGDPGAAHQGATAGERSGQGSDPAAESDVDAADAANAAPAAITAATSGSTPGEADHLHLVL
jgi:flagellar hook-length control protein FliK